MSVKPIPAVLHATSMSVMAYGFMSLGTIVSDQWIRDQFGGHWQFLTILGLGAAWITMGLSLLGDLFPYARGLNSAKRSLLMISLPVAIVVSSIYWTLMLGFPHLILPPAEVTGEPTEPSSSSEAPKFYRIPLKMDMALHAAPAISLVLDFYLLERKYTTRQLKRTAPLLAIVTAISYSLWAEYCASINGAFPYPFLTISPPHIRAVIYFMATLLSKALASGIEAVQKPVSPKAFTN
ncbi:FAR-17a/AIG1-like protein [Ceratobasidium sp. AG-Ba]|nr:FAR-17a/AIG1-like protein [Ceratobasidium sp. AG-Ba]